MINIRTRNDLINWLEQNVPYPTVKRAMNEGSIENLGGFADKDHNMSSWIVRVVSHRFEKQWFVRIQLIDFQTLGTILVDTVPWEKWVGDRSTNQLYTGDNPELYKELKKAACGNS